jgi:hypothetical protein
MVGLPDQLKRGRLDRECAQLDSHFEQQLAEQGLAEDLEARPPLAISRSEAIRSTRKMAIPRIPS